MFDDSFISKQMQSKHLNVITDNVIIRLMESNWPSAKYMLTFLAVSVVIAYCYHLVNVITFCLSQCDYIKRLLLYSQTNNHAYSKHGFGTEKNEKIGSL